VLDRPLFWRRSQPGGAVVRGVLSPMAGLYAGVMALRNRWYEWGGRAIVAPRVPTISVGNLSVGGTGKTPITAWLAARLAAEGSRVGIVLRGYGDDEPKVLARLVPDAVIIADPDRVTGSEAAVSAGATAIVLDDAFQHRRAGRDLDVVLLSADAEDEVLSVLPAGPLREPLGGLRRAGLILITRKAAASSAAARLEAVAAAVAPGVPTAVVALAGNALHGWADGSDASLEVLRDRMVAAVSGIGEPAPFEQQLTAAGARVTGFRFADHHAYTAEDVRDLLARLPADTLVVCTLKDAVKLGPLWPDPAPPLWYLSQRITVERGGAAIDAALAALPQRFLARSRVTVDLPPTNR